MTLREAIEQLQRYLDQGASPDATLLARDIDGYAYPAAHLKNWPDRLDHGTVYCFEVN